ncbi:MAG TPA: polysaccharide deacetylase [Ktedonobacterales bacterium]|nr:polysaccharide deacetylase [Ktedonobacterales bacterium]
MPRHLVCLTFDFDAISLWIPRRMLTPTPVSQGEFGVVGAERILALLDRHGIAATWFIPGHTLETYPDLCRRIVAAGHEIGHHGYAHEPPVTLAPDEEERVLRRGNEAIQAITGAPARGYRSPAWDLSPNTVELLNAHGFLYDSSMMGHDCLPYRARTGDRIAPDQPAHFGPPTRLIELPVSWSLDDFPHFEYLWTATHLQQGLMRGDDVLANWVDDFRYMARETDWGALTYTFHPQVTGRGHRMLVLERLIESLKDAGAVFSRMDTVAAEFDTRAPFTPASTYAWQPEREGSGDV